jgi:3-oxoacyl-[acyl-carrier protein] reductase
MTTSMTGRVAIVTGVSRRAGIGFAITRDLLASGMNVLIQSWTAHDDEQPWGRDSVGMPGVIEALRPFEGRLEQLEADFALPGTPAEVVDRAVQLFGHVDVIVANHATSSGTQTLSEVTVEELDRSWAVNARASVLLTQAFAAQHDDRRGGGRVVFFTSGQHLAPMAQEVPYAISKGAIHQMTLTLADALIDRGITVNTVNPGPTDTGWANAKLFDQVRYALPAGRWGSPDDVSRLVSWLVSDDAAWITGQVLNSEGGFRRWKM